MQIHEIRGSQSQKKRLQMTKTNLKQLSTITRISPFVCTICKSVFTTGVRIQMFSVDDLFGWTTLSSLNWNRYNCKFPSLSHSPELLRDSWLWFFIITDIVMLHLCQNSAIELIFTRIGVLNILFFKNNQVDFFLFYVPFT